MTSIPDEGNDDPHVCLKGQGDGCLRGWGDGAEKEELWIRTRWEQVSLIY